MPTPGVKSPNHGSCDGRWCVPRRRASGVRHRVGGLRCGPRGRQANDDVAARVALRLLVDAYARHVDRRDTDAVAALFSDDGRLSPTSTPAPTGRPRCARGRAEIAAALVAGLERYLATTHVVGGQVVELDPDGDARRGETVCLAHHVYDARRSAAPARHGRALRRRLRVRAGTWRFAERQLRLDWRDDRPVAER